MVFEAREIDEIIFTTLGKKSMKKFGIPNQNKSNKHQ